MLRRCCVFMNQGPPYNLSHPTYILIFQQCFFYMNRAKGRHAKAFVYWWTPGIFYLGGENSHTLACHGYVGQVKVFW
jgi:hypothetical protein